MMISALNGIQTAVVCGDRILPAILVKRARGTLTTVAEPVSRASELGGVYSLLVPSCVAHYTQGLGGVSLVTPWYSQLPKSKVTLKALMQELLMVGCAAGTIKNVWCRISDRHGQFGHNAPLSAAGDFKRLCKSVAAVKGAPRSFLFPSAVNTTCSFLDLTGLTECQARDVLVCATRMALCGRVVEVTDFCG